MQTLGLPAKHDGLLEGWAGEEGPLAAVKVGGQVVGQPGQR